MVSEAGERIIVEVDDEPRDSLLDQEELVYLSAKKNSATSLNEARGIATQVGPLQGADPNNVVFVLDLMFPQDPQEGIDFIAELRDGRLDVHRDTPIVVHSNAASEEWRNRATEFGANAFFAKTCDPAEFLDTLGFYLGRERVKAAVLCEVLDVDLQANSVRIRIRGEDGWIAERSIDLEVCPRAARLPGGSFFLDTISRFRNFRQEDILRSRSVDPEEDLRFLRSIFGEDYDNA